MCFCKYKYRIETLQPVGEIHRTCNIKKKEKLTYINASGFKSISASCYSETKSIVFKLHFFKVKTDFYGENRKQLAVTLYYQRIIFWPALDGLMIDCCSFIFWRGQMPTNMTAPVSRKECNIHLSFS